MAAIPRRLSHDADGPWFLDNGAFRAHVAGETWDADAFSVALDDVTEFADLPEFVVLPDVVGDAVATSDRAGEWVEAVTDRGLTPFGVIQPGRLADQFAQLPRDVEGVLVGGGGGPNATRDWRRSPTATGRRVVAFICDLAGERGLTVHVGRPGPNLAWWVHETAVDSLDTSGVVRNKCWDRLRRVEAASDPEQMALI
ncbi:hypothetical protein [Halomarina oriensis]|uniref:Uncharacterized protein n=1 Tax=Halomarina oriensis TaxID=671145 RepID=A0A6B0GEH1_9EURY|nr:hypothetical protein [Halomarina oriensis]MWG33114.1 hypothetical protein [Halomarina oriensis]